MWVEKEEIQENTARIFFFVGIGKFFSKTVHSMFNLCEEYAQFFWARSATFQYFLEALLKKYQTRLILFEFLYLSHFLFAACSKILVI